MTASLSAVTATLLEDDTVLELVFAGAKGNVLNIELMEQLSAALSRHSELATLRLIVLRGAGRIFSNGASIEEHRPAIAPAMLTSFHRLLRQVASSTVPVAALVEGRCLGGGFELALCCHFVFATSDAEFACPEIKLGVFPPVLAALGAARLGGPIAERLLLTGDALSLEQAQGIGFLTGLLADSPRAELLTWYRQHLRPLSAFALRQGSKAIRRGSGMLDALNEALEATEKQYVEEVLASHDGNEGVEAFLAKRRALWHDR